MWVFMVLVWFLSCCTFYLKLIFISWDFFRHGTFLCDLALTGLCWLVNFLLWQDISCSFCLFYLLLLLLLWVEWYNFLCSCWFFIVYLMLYVPFLCCFLNSANNCQTCVDYCNWADDTNCNWIWRRVGLFVISPWLSCWSCYCYSNTKYIYFPIPSKYHNHDRWNLNKSKLSFFIEPLVVVSSKTFKYIVKWTLTL